MLQSITEEVKKQPEQRIRNGFIMHVPAIQDVVKKITQKGWWKIGRIQKI